MCRLESASQLLAGRLARCAVKIHKISHAASSIPPGGFISLDGWRRMCLKAKKNPAGNVNIPLRVLSCFYPRMACSLAKVSL